MSENISQNDFEYSEVAGRYASALYDVAVKSNVLNEVESQLSALEEIFTKNDDFSAAIANPTVEADQKVKALSALATKAKLHKVVKNFLCVAAQNGRAAILPLTITQFKKIIDEEKGLQFAKVTSATELGKDEIADIKKMLKAVVGQDIKLELAVDPSILGGMTIRIGSQLFDDSLSTKLQQLKSVMKE